MFRELSGFDEQEYPYASIEDIELGLRMSRARHRIHLLKSLQVCHWKRWTIGGLLKADILRRAVPWTKLMATHGEVTSDLNLGYSQRLSALLAGLMIPFLLLIPFFPFSSLAALGCAAGIVLLNFDFYRFFFRLRGPLFTPGVFFWHLLYFLYSSITFVICWIRFRLLGDSTETKSLGARA